jgi:hypothetical protein
VHQSNINSSCILPKAHEKCYGDISIRRTVGGVGGLYHGAREASVEAKASEDSLTGIGDGRGIVVTGGRSICGN